MGFRQAGMDIVFAADKDHDAAKTFEMNFPETRLLEEPEFDGRFRGIHYLQRKIEEFPTEALQPLVDTCNDHPILFAGCAPCQPFTHQNTQLPAEDDRRTLLDKFRHFVEYYSPEFVFVENVPGLQKICDERGAFGRFLNSLKELNYSFVYKLVAAQHYGVPQKRSRLVLIASRLGKIEFPPKTHGRGTDHPKYSTVREWIGDLPPIKAGETHPSVPNHRAAGLWPINLERIRATPPGGDRRDWPDHLHLECHSKGYRGHTDVYGRLRWNQPASCLTTKCTSLSNGRFGHPEQDRAISAREAACLQTFPRDFVFCGGLGSISRQIGNAVPVLLARHFGENFVKHLQDHLEGKS
jgi:DNA (cytosine-5)-methyltransferase 1